MRPRRPGLRRIGITATVATVMLLLLAGLLRWTAMPAPAEFASVREQTLSSDAWLLDRNGEPLQSLRMDYRQRRLAWTPLQEISPALIDAVIQAEDQRYDTHRGVDLRALLGATRDRLLQRNRRGASTIAMQLAAQLYPQLQAHDGRRGVLQKMRQMRAAWALGARWSHAQMLEAYLNLVGFRGETAGVASAAAMLFDKAPSGLTAQESWTLAALLPAPSAEPQKIAWRACALSQASGADCDEQRRVSLAALQRSAVIDVGPDLAPQLARRLLHEPGQRLVTTLDADLQRLSLTVMQAQLRQLQHENVRDGAAVIVDNASGAVRAYVASAGVASRAAQVDGARAVRQAGSTLKPFLYSLAIERRLLTANSQLDDRPVALQAGNGLYVPQNYEHDYKGVVSARTALAGSLNIPAVRVLILTGVDGFLERLQRLGYRSGLTEPADYYGYSLALGSAEVSLLEQVNAFRSLANNGLWTPLRYLPDTPPGDQRRVIDARAAWIVSDMLSDRSARAITFDLNGPLSTPYWAAVKTGTSKDLRDNWCIGYSARYTVGVWVGNFEGDPMRTVSGITGAAPAWRNIMDALERGSAGRALAAPTGLVRARDTKGQGEEWFIAGTEHSSAGAAPALLSRPQITAPDHGGLIALDPDIPLDRQQMLFIAEPQSANLHFELDGRRLGSAARPLSWLPLPGTHRAVLRDREGTALDEVTFSVRGIR